MQMITTHILPSNVTTAVANTNQPTTDGTTITDGTTTDDGITTKCTAGM